MERIKHPIGRPKLQPHMTLQSLGKHIKQDSKEGTSNQESKKCRKGTWEKKGSKDIHVFGVEDKRQITIAVSFVVDGRILVLQIIFTRPTMRCLPQNGSGKASCLGTRFHSTYFANHWSTLETCQQFVERILIPCHNNEAHELKLPQNQKMVWLIDCWSVHKNIGIHTMDQITTSTSLFNVYTYKLYLQDLAYKCDYLTPIQACV